MRIFFILFGEKEEVSIESDIENNTHIYDNEVNEYFINKYDLVNNVLNTITDIMSAIKKTHFPYAIDCD